MKLFWAIVIGLCWGVVGTATAQTTAPVIEAPPTVPSEIPGVTAVDNSVQAVANHLLGVMSTAAQAAVNPNFVGVQMTTCEVIVDAPAANSLYLYQEQALSENLAVPYRQRFLQLTLSAAEGSPSVAVGQVDSRTYKPIHPQAWTGFCQQPMAQRRVAIADLGLPVCTITLQPSILGYVGSTPEGGCPVDTRGAVRATNTVVLHSQGMDTWDRGFNAAGIQVWGAEGEPYRYRWISRGWVSE